MSEALAQAFNLRFDALELISLLLPLRKNDRISEKRLPPIATYKVEFANPRK